MDELKSKCIAGIGKLEQVDSDLVVVLYVFKPKPGAEATAMLSTLDTHGVVSLREDQKRALQKRRSQGVNTQRWKGVFTRCDAFDRIKEYLWCWIPWTMPEGAADFHAYVSMVRKKCSVTSAILCTQVCILPEVQHAVEPDWSWLPYISPASLRDERLLMMAAAHLFSLPALQYSTSTLVKHF